MKRTLQLLLLLLVAGKAGAQYHSLIWKISGNGLKEPSYLFGTMHTADARIVDLGDKLAKPYFPQVKAYAMELDPGEESFNAGLLSKLMMGKGYSLMKMLPDKEYRFLDSVVTKQVGYPMALFDNIAPIFVLTIFETMSLGLSDSSIDGNTQLLDLYFYKLAKDQKKKIIGVETAEEQLKALGELPYPEQATLLVQEIDSFQQNQNGGKDAVRYYLNQDLDSLSATDDDNKKPEKYYKALVLDRNERMAKRIGEFIKKQPTFIAIGALHLPGKEGVIELLRKQGYTVGAVKE
jgi:uncharacterized protein YbaP (TraB family)